MSFDLHDFQNRQAEALAQLDSYKDDLTRQEQAAAEVGAQRESATRELTEHIERVASEGIVQPQLFESLGLIAKAKVMKKPENPLALEGDELASYVTNAVHVAQELHQKAREAQKVEEEHVAAASAVRKEYHEAIKAVIAEGLLPKSAVTQAGHLLGRK